MTVEKGGEDALARVVVDVDPAVIKQLAGRVGHQIQLASTLLQVLGGLLLRFLIDRAGRCRRLASGLALALALARPTEKSEHIEKVKACGLRTGQCRIPEQRERA